MLKVISLGQQTSSTREWIKKKNRTLTWMFGKWEDF